MLRPYQNITIEKARELAQNNNSIILCLPTGAGKTVIFSEFARLIEAKEKKCLILTDRTELCSQAKNYSKNPQIINPNNKRFSHDAKITIAMAQTLRERLQKGLGIDTDVIIIDECHSQNFNYILDYFLSKPKKPLVLGFTATPIGKHLIKYYQTIYQPVQVSELINLGYLTKCWATQMKSIDFSEKQDLKIQHGDYTEASQMNIFDKKVIYDNVLDTYIKNQDKTIIFCVNIADCKKTYQIFKDANIETYIVSSKSTNQDRKNNLLGFKYSKNGVIVNCGVLTTGFDEPSIVNVFLKFATTSKVKFFQTVGRGSRKFPNKDYFKVFDFGGNHDRLNTHYEQDQFYTLTETKEKKDGIPIYKTCKGCEALIYASCRTCEYCGYEYTTEEQEPQQGVWVEVKPIVETKKEKPVIVKKSQKELSEMTITELYEAMKNKTIKHTQVKWHVARRPDEQIEEFTKLANYKKDWVNYWITK